MKTKIVNPEIAKTANFLPGTLIPSDLLPSKKKSKDIVNNKESEPNKPSHSDSDNAPKDTKEESI